MKVLLMYPDRDSAPYQLRREQFYGHRGANNQPQRPRHTQAMLQDLELRTLLNSMAGNDEFLFEVAENAVLSGFGNDAATILYRQTVLKDCLKNEAVVRQLYGLTVEAVEATKRNWWGLTSHFASSVLHSSIDLLEFSLVVLKKLRTIADEQIGRFESGAFTAFFAMLQKELSDEYLATAQNHLVELKFRKGVLLSAGLGKWNESTNLLLRKAPYKRQAWLRRILGRDSSVYTFHLDPRDEAGARILSEMRQRGISRVVMALAESGDHVLNFFKTLRTELAFYVGCLNLHSRLAAKGEPVCFPTPKPTGERKHVFTGYTTCVSRSAWSPE